jgi:hypothetical protein
LDDILIGYEDIPDLLMSSGSGTSSMAIIYAIIRACVSTLPGT